jgi:hypothetical protein
VGELAVIEVAPGMKDIKWVDLYSETGKYVPQEKWETVVLLQY